MLIHVRFNDMSGLYVTYLEHFHKWNFMIKMRLLDMFEIKLLDFNVNKLCSLVYFMVYVGIESSVAGHYSKDWIADSECLNEMDGGANFLVTWVEVCN